MMIGIINMQTNNINCFIKIIKKLNFKFKVINSYEDYNEDISKLIIPGIGNYNTCINYLILNKLDKVIYEHNNKNKKILGICIGMQILTSYGEEGGKIDGLNILQNTKTVMINTKEILPHIGWNKLEIINKNNIIFNNVNLDADFYFVHSYNVICNDENLVLARTKYGNSNIVSIIEKDNILAIQFHPEKSGINGVKLIENFINN